VWEWIWALAKDRRFQLAPTEIRKSHSLQFSSLSPGSIAPLSLLKISTGLREVVIFASRPYRHGHGDDSLCHCIDLGFPFRTASRSNSSWSLFSISWPFCADNAPADLSCRL
jgi:hypothetical protein